MNFPKPLTQLEIETMGTNLLEAINKAFANVTIDNGVTLSEAHAIDNDRSKEKCALARAKDTYKHWNEVNLAFLDPSDSALSFVDPIGFRFHAPAYMTHCIKQQLSNQYTIDYDLVFRFDINCVYSTHQASLLQPEERRCIANYLIFSCESDYTSHTAQVPDGLFSIEDFSSVSNELSVMRRYWWNDLKPKEQELLLERWPFLGPEPKYPPPHRLPSLSHAIRYLFNQIPFRNRRR